jgi:hypothetical protein
MPRKLSPVRTAKALNARALRAASWLENSAKRLQDEIEVAVKPPHLPRQYRSCGT